jgi:hypothetical protein
VTGSCENFDTGEESRVYPAVIVWANAVTAYLLHKLGHLTVNTYQPVGDRFDSTYNQRLTSHRRLRSACKLLTIRRRIFLSDTLLCCHRISARLEPVHSGEVGGMFYKIR